MAQHHGDLDQSAAEIRRRSTEMLSNMAKQRNHLREVQKRLNPKQFRQWALNELGMDEVTLEEFLIFDGTMDRMTEHMLRWIMTSATDGKMN